MRPLVVAPGGLLDFVIAEGGFRDTVANRPELLENTRNLLSNVGSIRCTARLS